MLASRQVACNATALAARVRDVASPDAASHVRAWAAAAATVREGEALPVLEPAHELLFCPIPKAGCTQVRAFLLRLRGQQADLSRDPWAVVACGVFFLRLIMQFFRRKINRVSSIR